MGGGGVFKKTDSGFGAGVRPTAGLMNSPDNLISQGRDARMAGWKNPNARSVNPHGKANYVGSMNVNPRTEQATSGAGWGHGSALSDQFVHGQEGIDFIKNENLLRGYEYPSDKPTYGGAGRPINEYTADDIAALQLEYDTDEELRQDKLDKMSQLAQGQGGSGGGVSGQIVGDGGDLNIQQVAMERGKDGFPTLADFEQPLHPFMGKRKLNLKGYA